MSDQREIATRLIAIGIVQKELADEDRRLREEFRTASEVGDRTAARLFDGAAPIGTVTMAAGSETATVTDYEALLAWALERHPGWIERKPSVGHPYVERLKAEVKDFGGHVVQGGDPECGTPGEIIPVPGIEVRKGDPKPMVKANPAAKAAVLDAIRSGTYRAIESPSVRAVAGGAS